MRPDAAAARGPSPDDWLPAYLRVRALEGRLYPDDVAAGLPSVPASHPLHAEWRIRARSAARLLAHLRGLGRRLAVVDAGCGNGWLANAIASLDGTSVVGIDVNGLELAQANRVFGGRPNLRFVRADILCLPDAPAANGAPATSGRPTTSGPPTMPGRPAVSGLPAHSDVVVLASVVQYVADLPALLRRLRSWLAVDGEIHVLDSPFYRPADVAAARERTARHYADLGVPEMAEAYHHHRLDELAEFEPTFLQRPGMVAERVARLVPGRRSSPFPWLRIRRGDAP